MAILRYITVLLALVCPAGLRAQDGMEIKTPERINRMLEAMPVNNMPKAGRFQCTELSGTILFYTEAEHGVTVQLGALLFSDAVRKAYDPVIISFVERLWVELLLRKTTASQSALLKEYGVRIVLNGYPLGTGSFRQLGQALYVINTLSSLSITTGGNEIDMFMRDKAGSTLHIYIPASRDLLFPYDKKEHEELLLKELAENTTHFSPVIPDLNDPQKTPQGLLVQGGECYMIDSLKNDVFFTQDRKLLYDSKWPEQTMQNILMCAVSQENMGSKRANIKPHTYSKQNSNINVSLDLLLGYFQKQGLRFYTGTMGLERDNCQCLLAMYHPVYNYLHILTVRFTPTQLESGGRVTFNADLSTFIPQHNIKNLFQEK
jgi:hypothetical protein